MANLAAFNGEAVTIKAATTCNHLEGGRLQIEKNPQFEGKVRVVLNDGATSFKPNEIWLNRKGKFLSELIE